MILWLIMILCQDLRFILQRLLGLYLVLVLELVLQLRDVSSLPLHNKLRENFDIVLASHIVGTLHMGTLPLIVAKYPASVVLDGF